LVRADQPAASAAHIIAVWVQLVSAFGISGVMIAHGWFVHRPLARRWLAAAAITHTSVTFVLATTRARHDQGRVEANGACLASAGRP